MITFANRKRTEESISSFSGIHREEEFRRIVVVYGVMADIPWEEDESEAFDADIELMRSSVEESLTKRGEEIKHIPYKAIVWHLNGTNLSFKGFNDDMFHKARKFALYEILSNKRPSLETIKSHVRCLSRFFSLYFKAEPNAHVRYIHVWDIISFFEGSNIALSSKCNMLTSLIKFYRFWQANYIKERLPVDIDRLTEYYSETASLYMRTKETRRYPSIPDKVFYLLHFRLMALIRNPCIPFNDAVTACIVVLHMWTGLRPKEIRCLLRGYLVQKVEQGETLYFYDYISPKNKNRRLTMLLFPAALEAIERLEALQASRDNEFVGNYLVSYWDHRFNEPESYSVVINAYNSFVCKYMADILCLSHEGFSRIEYNGIVTYRPSLYMYRVHLCTYLIDHGLDERWVEAHLGHLSQTIRGRYYRLKEWRKEAIGERISEVLPESDKLVKNLTDMLIETRPQESATADNTLEMRLLNLIKINNYE